MPGVAGGLNLSKLAFDCRYPYAVCVENIKQLDEELEYAKKN